MRIILISFVFVLLWSYTLPDTCVTPLGVTSNCVLLYNCPEFVTALEQRPVQSSVVSFLRKSQCGFEDHVPTVCCGPLPSQQMRPQITQAPNPNSQPIEVQGEVDRTFVEDSSPAPQNQCGIDTNGDKIYQGELTELTDFPWLVLEGYRKPNGSITYQCGGMLINPRYVLTAAHCITGAVEREVGTLYSVRLGEFDLEKEVDCMGKDCADPPQDILVQGAYPHPGFSDDNKNRRDDIGLIRLAKRAKYSYYVQPICLANNNKRLIAGNDVYVAGWGRTLSGRNSPIKLKLVMQIFDKTECLRLYKKFEAELTDKHICAGGIFAKGTCRGDSGNPLMMMTPGGVWEAVGIVSFGYGCGRDGWPGVSTSVAGYLDWILSTMRTTNV